MAMTLSSSFATIGLQSRFTATNTNVIGQIPIGSSESVQFSASNAIYSLQAFMASASSTFTLDQFTGATSGATTWTSGTAQVETATATGTASTSGTVTITITASGMTGSPKAIAVPILSGDTASVWAGKVRTALAADTAVAAFFSVSGATTSIVLTREPSQTIEGSNIAVPYYAANDSTLNIAISAGTTGVTSAATSANTTAGVATSGCLLFDGDGKDIEGNTIGTLTTIDAALFKVIDGGMALTDDLTFAASVDADGQCLLIKPDITDPIDITATAAGAIQITILGTI
jgi:hypothetical protein